METLPDSAGLLMTNELTGGGHVLFTSRTDGNMSSVGGIDHEDGRDARGQLRARLGLRALVRGYQVHGTTVLSICTDSEVPDPATDVSQPPVQADGHATSVAGVGVMALAADCLPVGLGCEGAVAMIHAGWRGLAAGVLEEGVRTLRGLYRISAGETEKTGEIVAVMGPGAGPCCYEVGTEVHAAFESTVFGAGTIASGGIVRTAGGEPAPTGRTIDLKSIAKGKLLAAGVQRVHDVGICTICDERFFSHRREHALAGRQAGVAWLS